jgi:hypothetical protein
LNRRISVLPVCKKKNVTTKIFKSRMLFEKTNIAPLKAQGGSRRILRQKRGFQWPIVAKVQIVGPSITSF